MDWTLIKLIDSRVETKYATKTLVNILCNHGPKYSDNVVQSETKAVNECLNGNSMEKHQAVGLIYYLTFQSIHESGIDLGQNKIVALVLAAISYKTGIDIRHSWYRCHAMDRWPR